MRQILACLCDVGLGRKFSLKTILVKFATPILSGIFVFSLGYGEEKACCFA